MREVSKDYRTQVWGEIVETIFAPYLVIPLMLESFGISVKEMILRGLYISMPFLMSSSGDLRCMA